jgi:hypothetical protein
MTLVVLLSARARAAEHDFPASRVEDATERVSLSVSNRAGLAEAPFVTTAFPEVSGFALVLSGSAAVRLSSIGWLRVRLPFTFVRLDFPAGAQISETAFGNLELCLEHEMNVRAAPRVAFLAALLAPSAEHGPELALLDNRALALASALTGGKDSPLLTPGVSGLRLGASVEHSLPPLQFRGSLDLPLLVRLSDASLPKETKTNAIGLLPALSLKGAWWIKPWFGASLGGRLLIEALRVQEPALERDREQRLQFVLEPGVRLRLGQHAALGLDGSIPVGGALGGDAWSVDTHVRLGF